MVAPEGFDDPETRGRWALERYKRSRELATNILRDRLADYADALGRLKAARESGGKTARLEVLAALKADHLAEAVLVVNGHAPLDKPAPHVGFAPNAATCDGWDLLVVPGNETSPHRGLIVFPNEEEDHG